MSTNKTSRKLQELKALLDHDTPIDQNNPPEIIFQKQELNDKQILFALEYTKDRNATQAAIRAGYSETSARLQGHNLKQNPLIKAEINKHYTELALQNGITLNFQLEKLLNQINKYEELMDQFIDIDTFNSLTKVWLLLMKEVNQICGLYNINITNYNIEVPLFPDATNNNKTEDIDYTNEQDNNPIL